MKELQELIYIISKNPPDTTRIISPDFQATDSKMQQLLKAIMNQEVADDNEAAKLIYGERQQSSKYRNLKHELKKRLLNTIFLINTSSSKDRDVAYYECWKNWAACQILIEKSGRNTAIQVAQRLLTRAKRYDFLGLAAAISLFLRNHYALRERNKHRFHHYNELYQHYRQEEDWNNLAHRYYMLLILDHTQDSVVANPQIELDAERYLNELTPLKERAQNVKFHYYLYQIKLLSKMGVFNYQAAKEVCTEAIAYLNSSKLEYKSGTLNFLLNKLVCHIQLGEFAAGTETANACNKLVEKGTFNWFKTNEHLLLLSFHTGQYQNAYDCYHAVMNNPRFRAYPILHETWSLYKMYLHFLYQLGKIVPVTKDKSFSAIRLGKFLNEVPSFGKDKRGMNIPVLIIQMAFLILQHKYNLATERIDVLNKYCDRYIKTSSPNFRCNCFIKMLLQIPRSAFHRNGSERRARPYLERMKTISINFSNQAHEVEILPFEDFWGLILSTLDNKFYSSKNKQRN